MTRTAFEKVLSKSAQMAKLQQRRARLVRTPLMMLRSRRVRLKRLRRMNGFAPRLQWVRAGFPAPSLLLHPFQRNRILNEEIAAVSIQISKVERARSIQRVFEQLYLHQKGRVRSPSAPPPAEILSQYRLVYNSPPEFVRDDDELVEVAFELLTTRTRRDEGGDFPPLLDFCFMVEGIRSTDPGPEKVCRRRLRSNV